MIHHFIKNLLLFNRPKINELVCANLFVEGKAYLYIYWQVADAFKVRIKGYKTIYSTQSTLIFKIPNQLTQVKLTYSNVWRKKKVTVPLLKLSIDASVLSSMMIDNFRPKRTTSVKGIQLRAIKPAEFNHHPSAIQLTTPIPSIQYPFLFLKHHPYE